MGRPVPQWRLRETQRQLGVETVLRKQAEASCAALREALELWLDEGSDPEINLSISREALADGAGAELLARLSATERQRKRSIRPIMTLMVGPRGVADSSMITMTYTILRRGD